MISYIFLSDFSPIPAFIKTHCNGGLSPKKIEAVIEFKRPLFFFFSSSTRTAYQAGFSFTKSTLLEIVATIKAVILFK